MLKTLTKSNLRTGKIGEWLASFYFIFRGFRIVARNIRSATGETDLVVYRNKVWRLVEVRTRTEGSVPTTLESILPFRKRRKLLLNRESLVNGRFFRNIEESKVHVDCLWITLRKRRMPEFRHIEGIDTLEESREEPLWRPRN
jgi:Holliday junction resolvase-like predicted endonuclease